MVLLWEAVAPLDPAVSVPAGTRIFLMANPSSFRASPCQQTSNQDAMINTIKCKYPEVNHIYNNI